MIDIAAVLKVVVALITGHGGAAATGAAIALGLVYGIKLLPKFLGAKLSSELAKGFNSIGQITDPKRRELVQNLALDLVKLAEYEIPDAGQGRARFEKVAAKLCIMLPALAGQDKAIADLIEAAVTKMDEALKINVVK